MKRRGKNVSFEISLNFSDGYYKLFANWDGHASFGRAEWIEFS
jgi:hypothetical protein